jgi:hypothetical protein
MFLNEEASTNIFARRCLTVGICIKLVLVVLFSEVVQVVCTPAKAKKRQRGLTGIKWTSVRGIKRFSTCMLE